MNSRRSFSLLWILLAAISTAGPALGAVHGTYLPGSLALDGIKDIAYGNANATQFKQDVICTDCNCKVGYIDFSYDTWTGKTDPGDLFTGGGALAGGFFLNSTCTLKPGFQLGWVQTVVATIPGDTGKTLWGAQPDKTYPDTKVKTDPDYPFESLPGGLDPAPNPLPSIAFQDFPNRYPSDGNQYWLAELGLVCQNTTTHEASIIDTFLWGFDVTQTPAGITANAPHFWSAPTSTYVSTLENAFDGTGGSTKWTFKVGCEDCFTCVPEPATIIIWSLLGGVGLVFAWRKRKAA